MASIYIQGLQLGSAALGTFSKLSTENIQADMKEAAQAYSNEMRAMASAQQINAVTEAQVHEGDASRRMSTAIQQSAMQDRGAAEVSAAAAGVAGGSVDQAMLGLRRSAMQAQHARKRNIHSSQLSAASQKSNITQAGIMGKDVSVIQRPSAASAMLGLGARMVDIMDSNKPEGSKSTDPTVKLDWFKPF